MTCQSVLLESGGQVIEKYVHRRKKWPESLIPTTAQKKWLNKLLSMAAMTPNGIFSSQKKAHNTSRAGGQRWHHQTNAGRFRDPDSPRQGRQPPQEPQNPVEQLFYYPPESKIPLGLRKFDRFRPNKATHPRNTH